MRLKYREIHRAEIKRRIIHDVDRRMEWLVVVFCASILFVIYGVKLCISPNSASYVFGGGLLVVGALLFAGYRWRYRVYREQENMREWLTLVDHVIVTVIILLAGVIDDHIPNSLFFGGLIATVFSSWRLWLNSRPYWRSYYFRAGRAYFREIKSYTPLRRE